MVLAKEDNGNEIYICEECDMAYEDEVTAKKCEDYCKKYKSCSLEITKKAIKIQK